MKNFIFFIIASLFSVSIIFAQGNAETRVPLLGEKAPEFKAESTNGPFSFPKDFGKNWKILFSHPLDFTPVCSTELLELANMQSEFDKLGVKIIIISTDKLESHKNWKKSLESLTYKNRKPITIDFPLVDDNNRQISMQYGMIHPLINGTKNVRGIFIIDPENKIRYFSFYPMEVGRNLDELLRTVFALQTIDSRKVLTPANWQPGGDVLIPFAKTNDDGSTKVDSKNDANVYEVSWYMHFLKIKNE